MSLTDDEVKQIIIMFCDWKKPVKVVANSFGVTRARVYQLAKIYHETGEYPIIHKRGRKPREITPRLRQTIISIKNEFGLGSATNS